MPSLLGGAVQARLGHVTGQMQGDQMQQEKEAAAQKAKQEQQRMMMAKALQDMQMRKAEQDLAQGPPPRNIDPRSREGIDAEVEIARRTAPFRGSASGGGAGGPGQQKPATEGERTTGGFAARMENAEREIGGIKNGLPTAGTNLAGALPIIGDWAERKAQSPEQQMYRTLSDEWIRAKLRKESGAAISEQEREQEYNTYFPLQGDSPQTVALKKRLRDIATGELKRQAGAGYDAGRLAPVDQNADQRNAWDKAAVTLSTRGKSEQEIVATLGPRP